jgi:hypothetical protein
LRCGIEQIADLLSAGDLMHAEQGARVVAAVLFLHAPLVVQERRTLHENTEKALSHASPIAYHWLLPPLR